MVAGTRLGAKAQGTRIGEHEYEDLRGDVVTEADPRQMSSREIAVSGGAPWHSRHSTGGAPRHP